MVWVKHHGGMRKGVFLETRLAAVGGCMGGGQTGRGRGSRGDTSEETWRKRAGSAWNSDQGLAGQTPGNCKLGWCWRRESRAKGRDLAEGMTPSIKGQSLTLSSGLCLHPKAKRKAKTCVFVCATIHPL